MKSDTSAEAKKVQGQCWERMGPAARMATMLAMCEDAAAVSKIGIRMRHPEYSDAQVHDAFLVLLWGKDLFRRACPSRTAVDP